MIHRLLLASLVFGGLALAQGDTIPTDISAWFASTASLAAVIAALIALVRKHVLRGLEGVAVVGVSLVLGVALAYAGKLLGYLSNDWLMFGLSAGLLASGGVDLLRGIARGSNAAPAGNTGNDADRARLR